MNPLARYRATGADLPFGDPLPAHGVAMEGYFWRVTQPDTGRVLIALIGVNRGPAGPWATVGLAAHPAGHLAVRDLPGAWADPRRLGAGVGAAFRADASRLRVDLGSDGLLDLRIREPRPWPRRRFGGSSGFQSVPALNQYWHPWLLGGQVEGSAIIGGETWDLHGAQVYAEKNWGREGFPDSWWWGQAHGFGEEEACVAFAGGQVTAGPLRTEVTALVVQLPDGTVLRLGNPVVSPVRAQVTDETWSLRGRARGWEVEVEGAAPIATATVLPVPLPSEQRNTAGAIEHLAGSLSVVVRHRGRVRWRGESGLAGLEHGGLARAEAELRRRGMPLGSVCAPPESEVGSAARHSPAPATLPSGPAGPARGDRADGTPGPDGTPRPTGPTGPTGPDGR